MAMRTVSAVAAVILLGALSCMPVACGITRMTWALSSNSSALCNDFTRAGYFLRRNLTSDDWVIFLESGSVCFSSETCNRRFFPSNVRERFNVSQGVPLFGNFDPNVETFSTGDVPINIVSPLMSSMECFRNRSDYFPGGDFSLLGTDILDQDKDANPLFWSYNHVVIPYCSSDVWLGNEIEDTRNSTATGGECDCFDYDCFQYVPDSGTLQFTFRGKIIFESVLADLMGMGLDRASQLVLAGSSVGGLGVLNHAKYVRDLLPSAEMRVIFDSTWFINFQGDIFREFGGFAAQAESESQSQNRDAILNIIGNNEACSDTSLGFPCCTAAYCLFTQTNSAGERYYPNDVPTFGIFGLYDIFLLAPSLAGVAAVERERDTIGFAIDFLRIVGEYGGEMNSTVAYAEPQSSFFSYYVTQCFQHIYFATSSLWGADGASVFGSSTVEVEEELASFTHAVRSGIWSTRRLAGVTIREALIEWHRNGTTPVYFRDSCNGPYCNMECPEEFTQGELTSNNWHLGLKIIIAVLIVGVSVLCVVMKLIFGLWLCWLNWKQNTYLDTLDADEDEAEDKLQFPDCMDEDAISVACLDLHYSVTFRAKKDQLTPLVVHNITPDEADPDDTDDGDPFPHVGSSRRRGSRPLRRVPSQKHSTASEIIHGFVKRPTQHGDKSPMKDPETATNIRPVSQSPSPPVDEESLPKDLAKKNFRRRQREILKGISLYFNPGEMVGIMGPSGCGKTTFLDLLTGRRKSGTFSGDIYINGIKMEDVRDWYVHNTGYMLQLATPYYEQLTVRENLTLAAAMKLPDTFTLREKFERVEQVMEVSGLSELADTIVGGVTGPGLSGGQKRRLAVALQLLKLPTVIYLDEPTSGLDATSSFELLHQLSKLANSNRTIILTIHQPRPEIFFMFNRLVLLSDGKVAYHGVPEKAYEVFVNALQTRYLELGLIIPELEDRNPADVLLDMLGNPKMRQLITDYYQTSWEPALVTQAIKAARLKEPVSSLDTQPLPSVGYLIWGVKRPSKRHAGQFTRLAVLEARASKRANIYQTLYLPVIFFVYGVALGTVYLQTTSPLLIISASTVYSVASALFIFPVLYPYYVKALEVYTYERANGVGRSHDLVIQGFIRGVAISIFPVVISAGVLYVLLINRNSYDFLAFLQVVVVNIALNQIWIALLIAVICSYPSVAFRVFPIVTSVALFTGGFFIPVEQIPWWYRWMVYINPNYYGFSTVSFFLLNDFDSNCVGTLFECFTSSGEYTLQQFDISDINPYLHMVILLVFTVFSLFAAIFANWVHYTTIKYKLQRVQKTIFRSSTEDAIGKEPDEQHLEAASMEEGSLNDMTSPIVNSPLSPINEADETPPITPHTRTVMNWKIAASRSIDELQAKPPPRSLFLREGATHAVWMPKAKRTTPKLANVVMAVLKAKEAPHNMLATQAVLKEQNEELISSDLQPEQRRKRISLMEASRRILQKEKSQISVRGIDTVKMKTKGELSPTKASGEGATATVGAVPLQKGKRVIRQHKKLQRVNQRTDAGLQETRSPVLKLADVVFAASPGMTLADVPPQRKQKTSVASPQRQQWTEMRAEKDSAGHKTEEEPLQGEDMTQTVAEF